MILKNNFQEYLQSVEHFWIRIKPDFLSGLIWVQTVCKCYQQTTKVATSGERVNLSMRDKKKKKKKKKRIAKQWQWKFARTNLFSKPNGEKEISMIPNFNSIFRQIRFKLLYAHSSITVHYRLTYRLKMVSKRALSQGLCGTHITKDKFDQYLIRSSQTKNNLIH